MHSTWILYREHNKIYNINFIFAFYVCWWKRTNCTEFLLSLTISPGIFSCLLIICFVFVFFQRFFHPKKCTLCLFSFLMPLCRLSLFVWHRFSPPLRTEHTTTRGCCPTALVVFSGFHFTFWNLFCRVVCNNVDCVTDNARKNR